MPVLEVLGGHEEMSPSQASFLTLEHTARGWGVDRRSYMRKFESETLGLRLEMLVSRNKRTLEDLGRMRDWRGRREWCLAARLAPLGCSVAGTTPAALSGPRPLSPSRLFPIAARPSLVHSTICPAPVQPPTTPRNGHSLIHDIPCIPCPRPLL